MKIDETCVCGARYQLDTSIPEHTESLLPSFEQWRRIHAACHEVIELNSLRKWIADLQTGLYINCVYCGHRYGPNEVEVPADALRRHVAECPAHPMAQLVAVCRTVVSDIEQTARARGSFTAAEEMIMRQLDDGIKRATR